MPLSSIAIRLNLRGARTAELLYVAATLIAIGSAFLLAWRRGRHQDQSAAGSRDPVEWLLWILTALALIALASFLWLALRVQA